MGEGEPVSEDPQLTGQRSADVVGGLGEGNGVPVAREEGAGRLALVDVFLLGLVQHGESGCFLVDEPIRESRRIEYC